MVDAFLVRPGAPAALAHRATSTRYGESKDTAAASLARHVERLRVLHNRLWAEHRRAVLLVLQGMDASGKDGTIKRVFTGLNPQGCRVVSFRAPNDVERDHDFLWRIHAALPRRGEIGIFNRSHYEDIVTAAVLGLVDEEGVERRIRAVRDFERMLTDEGTTLVKVFLHIGKDEQRKRLQARLEDPEKRWKFRREDLDARARWHEYMDRYDAAITATSTEWAPWYVVPADHKWASGLAVAELLVRTLEQLDPHPPPPAADLDGLVVE